MSNVELARYSTCLLYYTFDGPPPTRDILRVRNKDRNYQYERSIWDIVTLVGNHRILFIYNFRDVCTQ